MIALGAPIRRLAQKNMLSLTEHSRESLESILATAASLKADPLSHRYALDGMSIVLLFEKPSLRTRISFEVGASKLGAHVVYMDHAAQRIGVRESVADYAHNLSLWTDCIVARTFEHSTIEELARESSVPVINGLSDLHHPCQALADFLTMREVFGSLEGLKVAYVGDGNNVCNSLMLGAAMLGVDMLVVCPDECHPEASVVRQASSLARSTGADLMITDEIEALHGRRVVYTDTWESMGQSVTDSRLAALEPYQVNDRLMGAAAGDAVFMHCLPAHRGSEVTASVIDSPRSAVLRQAENRMHVQNALLLHLLGS